MAARRDRRKPTLPENITTESDLQMKELLRKQIDTNVTLERQVLILLWRIPKLHTLKSRRRVVFLYGPPTNCYVAYTVIRRKIVFICGASYAVYTVITRKIGFM